MKKKEPQIVLDRKAFRRRAQPGHDAEVAIPLKVGRLRGMVGVSTPSDRALDAILRFLGLEVGR